MKLFLTGFFISVMIFSHSVFSDSVYVNGSLHTLTITDFEKEDNLIIFGANTYRHTISLEVVGDYGQQLIFQISGTVGGMTYQELESGGIVCSGDWPGQICAPSLRLGDFKYSVNLEISCSGIPIGTSSLLQTESNDTVSRYKEATVHIYKTLVTEGNCKTINIVLSTNQTKADLNLLIAEKF